MKYKSESISIALLALGLVLGASAARADEPAGGVQKPVSGNDLAESNNPLANLNQVQFQDYYSPSSNGQGNATSNAFFLRGIKAFGRQIARATLPFESVPDVPGHTRSGIGDMNVFDVFLLNPPSSKLDYGVGPLVVAPTASPTVLGSGKWQLGGAAVAIRPFEGGGLLGGLMTWQSSVAGIKSRPSTDLGTLQLFGICALTGGYYLRSTPIAVLDVKNNRYVVPFGLGVGRIFKAGPTTANAFFEVQPSIYRRGTGEPDLQMFTGLYFQWKSKPRSVADRTSPH